MVKHLDTSVGRTMAAFDLLTGLISNSGYTYADLYIYFNNPIPVEIEARWQSLASKVDGFDRGDRSRLLAMIERHAKTYPGAIVSTHRTVSEARNVTPDDLFAGIPDR